MKKGATSIYTRITGVMAAALLVLSSLVHCLHYATHHHSGGHFTAGSCSGPAHCTCDGHDCGSFRDGGHGAPAFQLGACRNPGQRCHDSTTCPICQAFSNLHHGGVRGQDPELFVRLEAVGGPVPPDAPAPHPPLLLTGFPRAPPAC